LAGQFENQGDAGGERPRPRMPTMPKHVPRIDVVGATKPFEAWMKQNAWTT
jgi:hypothetical protein